METYSNWALQPRFQIDLKSEDEFQNTQFQTNIQITILLESECHLNSPEFVFIKKFYGEPKPKNFYCLNSDEKKYIYIHPQNGPKKINFQSPGNAHISSYYGAQFCLQLIPFLETHSKNYIQNIYVNLSKQFEQLLHEDEFEFLLAILQKSITSKVKKLENTHEIKNLIFCDSEITKDSLLKAQNISNAMCSTRTLINMPANVLNPDAYEQIVRSLVRQDQGKFLNLNNVEFHVLDYEKLLHEKCTLICAVGQGSHYKPRIIKLIYKPKKSDSNLKKISLVGKGITFDSGGYDMKSAGGMRNMKKDMGGSAAALGVFFACSSLNLPVQVTCYLAIAENMVSAHAMRPGDVFQARNGLHIEIENTDAEGRLVLADAISLACAETPDWLIDFATLTGAARVSIGPMIDSLFGNNPQTTSLLKECSLENGDYVWEMPLLPDYENYLESTVADCLNSSPSGFAGSITAALFLQKFVTVENWNHIDTYMWCDKPNSLWQESNTPTGKCIRLVTRAIEKFILS